MGEIPAKATCPFCKRTADDVPEEGVKEASNEEVIIRVLCACGNEFHPVFSYTGNLEE